MQVGTRTTFIIVTFFLFLGKFVFSSVSNVIDDNIVEDASQVTEESSWGYWQLSRFVEIITGMNPGEALIDYSVFSEGWCTQHKYNIEMKYGISEKNPGSEESQNLFKIHTPVSEFKPLLKINSSNGNDNVIYLNRRCIPRSELNSLPLEPFQRVMTYAIEFNLIPDMWFLELIYCLYYSISTYLDGIVMSYTLQEIVSSALLTLDYKTESFLIEHCFSSVKRFYDDKIASKYVEICNSMFKCLGSKKFLSPESSELSKTLAMRIENTYKQYFPLKNLDGTFDHKLFGKYSLLLSISIFNRKRGLSMYSLEKNYLVISSMNASLALRLLAISINCPVSECSDSNIVGLGYKIVNSVKDLVNEFAIRKCIYLLFSSKFFKSVMKVHIASEFCVGLLSIGFINEKITVPSGIDLNLLSKAIMPSRITYPHYLELVPVISVAGHDEFSHSNWIEDYQVVDLGTEDGDEKLIRKKVFTLRKVSSKTSKATVKSRMVRESFNFKVNKTSKSKFKTGLTRLKRTLLEND
ncbi:putative Secreted Protein [Cryptosporidium xiaoi]|uniref:Secreted Protein n=1 Tax=Cryptosporidium xiaoi TaxID=659607 RepID=A0AAV9Y2C2_9CRYT